VRAIEQSWERDYEGLLGPISPINLAVDEMADTLGRLASQTRKKPALAYVVPGQKQLELLVVMPQKPFARAYQKLIARLCSTWSKSSARKLQTTKQTRPLT